MARRKDAKTPEADYEVVGIIVREKEDKQRQPDPVTPADAPGPDADAPMLRAWYRDVVQTYFATHSYDDFSLVCHWCLAEDQTVRERDAPSHGPVKYCGDRCADTWEAYKREVLRGGRQVIEQPEELPAVAGDDSDPLEEEPSDVDADEEPGDLS